MTTPTLIPAVTATLPTRFGAVLLAWDDAGLISVHLTADQGLEPSVLPRGGAFSMSVASGRLLERATRWIRDWEEQRFRPAELPVHLELVPEFTRKVLQSAAAIPAGETRTYAQLAEDVGRPGGARAVGQVMARNPWPLFFPCHRVVAASGLGGYGPGVALKRALLLHEGAPVVRGEASVVPAKAPAPAKAPPARKPAATVKRPGRRT